jgi:hypothetical protein
MARGFGCATLAIELNWYGAASDILLPRGEEGALFGIANGMPVLLRLVLRTRSVLVLRWRGVGLRCRPPGKGLSARRPPLFFLASLCSFIS